MGQDFGPTYRGLEASSEGGGDEFLYPIPAGFAGLPCRFGEGLPKERMGEAQPRLHDPLTDAPAPVDLLVKNTFLNYGNLRPPSLEGFFQERETRSAPGSGLLVWAEEHDQDCPPTPSDPGVMPAGASTPDTDEASAEASAAEPLAAWVNVAAPAFPDPAMHARPAEGWCGAPAQRGVTFEMDGVSDDDAIAMLDSLAQLSDVHELSDVPVLRLSEAIDDLAGVDMSQLGTAQLPTVGSAGHALGACKPCAFLDKGCANGQECKFCHLCPADEKNRRKKEKLAMRRQMCRWQRETGKTGWRGQQPAGPPYGSSSAAAMSLSI